jgi:general secretion pathway protein N
MMRKWAVAGALGGVLLGLLLHAPAVWLSVPLASATGARMQLLEVRGTVWRGEGRLQVGQGTADSPAAGLPGRVAWSWGWQAGAPTLELRADCCSPQPQRLRLVTGWRSLALQLVDGQSQWPAALLAGLGAPWNTVQAQGELQMRTQGLSVEWSASGVRLAGQLQTDALAMASRLSTLRPVGSYRLTLTGPPGDQPASLLLQTLEGPLRLQGSGEWTGQGWRFKGEASADPQSEAALQNLLNMLGRREGGKALLTLG